MKKTKIICTIGPASNNEETVRELMTQGMNASRHNFSHGTHETHKENMDLIKKVRKDLNKHVAILLDTKGPEIRTGDFKGDKVELIEGNNFTVVCGEEILGDETKCSITYNGLWKDVEIGDRILIDDGLVGLEVLEIEGTNIHTVVRNSGFVSNHKGINVPGVSVNLPALTEKDIADLKFGVEMNVDIVAASFIRKSSDVLDIKRVLAESGGEDILVFSKIENQEGVDNIDEIIKFSDGIMVARGDLGVEIPTEEVPLVQKMIIKKCNKVGKPVITATQMLDSMMRNPRPTRAEASDVANAILDGTDTIMLSGETASGKYPIEAVKTMAKIAKRVESEMDYEDILKEKSKEITNNVPEAISLATCSSAMTLKAKAIITPTQSGSTAKKVSKYRPKSNIIAVTPYEEVARRLALNWGVVPVVAPKADTTDEIINMSVDCSLEAGYLEKGDLVIIAAGIPANYVGSTNMMKVHIVGDVLVKGKSVVQKSGYGTVRVVKDFEDAVNNLEEGEVLVADKIDDKFLTLVDKVNGVIVEDADVSSNLVIICTTKDIPLIVKAQDACRILKTGSFVKFDGDRGIVFSGKTDL